MIVIDLEKKRLPPTLKKTSLIFLQVGTINFFKNYYEFCFTDIFLLIIIVYNVHFRSVYF